MTALEQTKGKFKVEGIIKGIKNEKAYSEGFTANTDKPYKSIKFFVETSPTNRVKVELFGMEKDEVIAYSNKAKESKRIKWADRNGNHGDFKVMGTNLFLEKGKDGKNVRKVMAEIEAVDYLLEHLKDGDSVRVSGQNGFQEFENQQGELKESTQFSIGTISKIDDIDFSAETFKEVAHFEQEIVVEETMVDDENMKLIISAKVIKYNKSGNEPVSATFVVDAKELPKLANNMSKRLSYGDFIKVYGLIINAEIRTEAEVTETMDDEDDWGGDDDVKNSMDTSYISTFLNELQVTSVESSSYESKKYKEEDLLSSDEDAFNGDIEAKDEFSEEEEIDDLPF